MRTILCVAVLGVLVVCAGCAEPGGEGTEAQTEVGQSPTDEGAGTGQEDEANGTAGQAPGAGGTQTDQTVVGPAQTTVDAENETNGAS